MVFGISAQASITLYCIVKMAFRGLPVVVHDPYSASHDATLGLYTLLKEMGLNGLSTPAPTWWNFNVSLGERKQIHGVDVTHMQIFIPPCDGENVIDGRYNIIKLGYARQNDNGDLCGMSIPGVVCSKRVPGDRANINDYYEEYECAQALFEKVVELQLAGGSTTIACLKGIQGRDGMDY
jgi:hypothetical protein